MSLSVFKRIYRKRAIFKNLSMLPRKIKWAWQRATRGYADFDAWGIDDWFMTIMPNMLQDLKNNHCGIPYFTDDMEADRKKWDEILDKMVYLLKEMNEDTSSQQNEFFKAYIRSNDSELCKAYRNRQNEINKYIKTCKNEFFKLFSEHFYDLWD